MIIRTGGGQFVLTSSGSVYGTSPGPLTEDSPLMARDFYSATKVAGRATCPGLRPSISGTTILRLFVPYGPGQARRMLPGSSKRSASGETIQLKRGGGPRMNPIYVDDVVRGGAPCADSDTGARSLNVAGDEVTDIRVVCGTDR